MTVLWALPGSATVEGKAAGLAINIQRLWANHSLNCLTA